MIFEKEKKDALLCRNIALLNYLQNRREAELSFPQFSFLQVFWFCSEDVYLYIWVQKNKPKKTWNTNIEERHLTATVYKNKTAS